MKQFVIILLSVLATVANAQRETILLNAGWRFALGNAASMQKDFGHGTEYFTYLSKAASANQNTGPAFEKFNDDAWQMVDLPHDWVVDLRYSSSASHSHGYKKVGWRYPEYSVGWYRRHFFVPKADEGRDIRVRFDGIFRNAQVFCNGFFLGTEPSGYEPQTYEIGPYLNYGADNVLTVRADASTEEGWYYEGAGIYRNVWLVKTGQIRFTDNSLVVNQRFADGKVILSARIADNSDNLTHRHTLLDAAGQTVGTFTDTSEFTVNNPRLWSAGEPYLYTLKSELIAHDGRTLDRLETRVGLRQIEFNPIKGFLVNGRADKLRGVNLHLDHAGTGTGIPNELWVYRLQKLKEIGVNAIRCSHNPATPAMLDVCDSMGFYVIDENRLMGTNDYHLNLLRSMIERDRNHPSVILWSIGNEEWQIESGERGEKIARRMVDFARSIDSTRLTTYGNSGGYGIVKQTPIHGYNYIVQNDVENRRRSHPDWFVIGTEETSGAGTRNVYETDSARGHMAAINYIGEERSAGEKNVIERGWKFYRDNSFAGGLFYWTGFDYRGEPNPMVWPSTGSEFGLLDYCGFPKDEAFYLKAAWTAEPVLHIFPHWNMPERTGQPIEVWAYSNMDEVELFQDGKSLGRKAMPKDGHLVWQTVYRPGRLRAVGYKNKRKTIVERVETTGPAEHIAIQETRIGNLTVYNLSMRDKQNREVPTDCSPISISLTDNATILGWGNGDPAFKVSERPASRTKRTMIIQSFMGKAQVLVLGNGSLKAEINRN